MPGAIDYKQEVNTLLATEVTDAGLKAQLTNGTIDPKKELYLDLGISVDDMKSLAPDFNDLIDKKGKVPKRYMKAEDLGGCKTVDAVYTLVGPSFPSSKLGKD